MVKLNDPTAAAFREWLQWIGTKDRRRDFPCCVKRDLKTHPPLPGNSGHQPSKTCGANKKRRGKRRFGCIL